MAGPAQARDGRRSPGALALALALVPALVFGLSACGKSATVIESGSAPPPAVASSSPAEDLQTRNTSRLGGLDSAIDAAAVARSVYPGLTKASRPGAVVLVDNHDWPAALAAAALAGAPLHAPLLYAEGGAEGQLPEASTAALAAMHPHGSAALGGAQVLALGDAALPTGYRTRRIAAHEPAALAASVAELFEELPGEHSKRVIVANPDGPRALAMPAAGLAAESAAPILFAGAASLPAATRAALERMKQPTIYAVGPNSVIGPQVIAQLRRLGQVKRIAHTEPVGNAIALAEYEHDGFGWGVQEPGHGLVFLNAGRPFDAPAAALLSATGEYGPQLLLGAPDRIPPALVRYLSYIQPGYASAPEYQPVRGVYNHGWLIGSDAAITARVQAELDGMLEIAPRSTSEASTTTTE